MAGWTMGVVVAILAVYAACRWFGYRDLSFRYKVLAARVSRNVTAGNTKQSKDIVAKVYLLIRAGTIAGNVAIAYKAIDLLKMLFADGVICSTEPLKLAGIVIGALRQKQPEIAVQALDAFRQMLRYLPADQMHVATEQLVVLTSICYRENYNFLSARAAEVLFAAMDRQDCDIKEMVQALRTMGVLALKRHDDGLFRELAVRLNQLVQMGNQRKEFLGEISALTGVWLYQIINSQDKEMFTILTDFVDNLTLFEELSQPAVTAFIREWYNAAGTACLNVNNELAPKIMSFIFDLTLRRWGIRGLELAVRGAGQVAQLVISQKGIKVAIPYLLPLLDTGRKILSKEMKYNSGQAGESFRQQVLFSIVREIIVIARFTEKKDIHTTFTDVISELYTGWLSYSTPAGTKSIKRFCQLIIVYWQQIRTKKEKKDVPSVEMTLPVLLGDQEKKKLYFLL
ncbi:MAG: hypothetical protein H6Q67_699 [Firmicutes bacterium]|nr:hypothetical protein [Bacillota bacterium]